MKKIQVRNALDMGWQILSTLAIVAFLLGLLLFGRLDSLLPAYSPTEVQSALSSRPFTEIINNPVNAPYKLTVFFFSYITSNPLLATRLAAATFGIATIILFYVGMRNWYRRRIAFLATVLFACSAWFLHTARFGSPDILLPCAVLLLTVCGYWIATAKHSRYSYVAAIIALSLCMYVPGLLWLLGVAAVVRRKDIALLSLRLNARQRAIVIGTAVVLVILPLLVSIIRNPHVGLELLGLPNAWPGLVEIGKNLLYVPVSLFAFTPVNPELQLGRLPLLDIFGVVMFVLGAYYYFKHRTLDRTKLLLVFLAISTVLIAIDGPVSIAIMLPAIYVIVTGGIAQLLGRWLEVFPRNPLAKSVGITLITIAVLASCLYNIRAYFVAWPNAPETKAIYTKTDLVQ